MRRHLSGVMAAGNQYHQDQRAREDERVMFTRLARERSPEARDAIIERFLPLARKLAWRYRAVEDLDDLEQVAMIGLVNAIARFDPARGLAFSSFAFPTILGELKRHLRDRNWSVRIPRDLQDLARTLERFSDELSASLGRSPTVAELAERAGCSVEKALVALQAGTARRALSLDAPAPGGDQDGAWRHDVCVEEAGFATAEDATVLDGLLRELPTRDREVLHLRFREDLTQQEIARIMGISQMQVSRTIRAALAHMNAVAQRRGISSLT